MSEIKINRAPCGSCPYRQDVPSGVWHASEYAKILPFDRETWAQPCRVFMCHQADGALCRGWLDCHGNELLGVRLAAIKGELDPEAVAKALEEGPAVPIFANAAAASAHGRAQIDSPSDAACKIVEKIAKKRKLQNKRLKK